MKNTLIEKCNEFLNYINEELSMYSDLEKNEAFKANRLKNSNKFAAINDVKEIFKTRQKSYDKKNFNEADIYNDFIDCLDEELSMYSDLEKNEALKVDRLKNSYKFEAINDVKTIFKTIY